MTEHHARRDRELLRTPRIRAAIRIAGIDFDRLTQQEAVAEIFERLKADDGGHVITPNIDILYKLQKPEVRPILRSATIVLADGAPIVWASRLLGGRLPERVTGADLIFPLCRMAANESKSVFLLGAGPGVAERAREVLVSQHAELDVAGVHSPPVGFERSEAGIRIVREKLRQKMPDIVFVALGFPKQGQLIAQLRGDFPSTWFVGCGAAIDFAAGNIRRAPEWMQRIGLEWAFRLSQEPHRLAKRYLVDDLPFALGLLARSFIVFIGRTSSPKRERSTVAEQVRV